MAQEETGETPQRGVLLRRAHELLESLGQPTPDALLIQHLFGVTGSNNALWKALLYQVLRSSSLFEQTEEQEWILSAWRSTHRLLQDVDFVVLDTETTGL